MATEDVKIKIKINGDTSSVNTSLKKTQKGFDGVTGKAKKATRATNDFGDSIKSMINPATLAAAALIAVGAGVTASVRAFSEFENELLGVKTLLSENSFGAKSLEDGFADMTREVIELNRTVPVALSNINKALFDTVSTGVAAGKAVKFVGVSAKLAVAGLTSVSIATDGMTSAMGAYELEAEDAELIASKFFAAQKQGKTTIEALAGGFGLVGSSAAAMGVSFNELLASVSAVTLAGVQTRAAYTGLKAILSNIAKPTGDAAKEAERLGISFNQTALRTLKLEGFLKQITSSSKFTKESLSKLFGSSEAVNVAFNLTANGGAKFSQILKALGDDVSTVSTLTNAYEVQASSTENQMKLLGKQFETASLQMGEEFAPALIEVSTELLKYAPAMIAASKATGEFLASLVSLATSDTLSTIIDNITTLPGPLGLIKTAVDHIIDSIDELNERNANPISLLRPTGDGTDPLEGLMEQLGLEAEVRQTFGDEQAALEEKRRRSKEAAEKKHSKVLLDVKKKEKTTLTKAEIKQFKFDQQMSSQKVSLLASTQQLINTLNTGNNKAAFLASKALAGAQITMAGLQSIMGAVALPPIGLGPVLGAPLAGLMKANMGIQLATLAATTFQGFAQGGLVAGGIPGVDSVPIMAQRGELIVPQQNFDEVISAVAGARNEESNMQVTIGFSDDAFEIIEQKLIERNALGIGAA